MAVRIKDQAVDRRVPGLHTVGPMLPDGVALLLGQSKRGLDERLLFLANGPSRADVQRTLEVIEDELFVPNRTPSARLTDSVQTASRRLASDNARSLAADRYRLDAALVLMRGLDIYVTLCGEVSVYALRSRRLYQMAAQEAGPPLGEEEHPLPLITRALLEPEDILIVAGGDLIETVPEDRIVAWFENGAKEGAIWLRRVLGDAFPVAVYDLSLAYQAPREQPRKAPALSVIAGKFLESDHDDGPAEDVAEPTILDTWMPKARQTAGLFAVSAASAAWQGIRTFIPSPSERTDELVEEVIKRPSMPMKKPWLVLGALGAVAGVVLLIVGLALGMFLSADRSEKTFTAAIGEAERAAAAASSSTDPITSRARLNDAEFAVQRALAVRSDDPAAKKLADSIRGRIAELDKVVRLAATAVIVDLGATGAKNPSGLVIESGNGYVLDDSTWGIKRIGLEPNKPAEPQAVMAKDSKSDESLVGDLAALAWMGQSENKPIVGLMAMDKNRKLFVQPGGKPLTELKVRNASSWGSFGGMRTYAGNIYVLDPKGNQVWRYTPTAFGYDSEPKGLLDNATIEGAIDFVVEKDIFVLTKEGRVWKFTNGIGTEFDMRALDKPITKPTAISTGTTANGVYVADSGNNRVVVFDKAGRFQRQFVSDAFSDLKALTVDEAQKKIFFIAGKKLYVAALPKD